MESTIGGPLAHSTSHLILVQIEPVVTDFKVVWALPVELLKAAFCAWKMLLIDIGRLERVT